jgi:DDE superfamily endonuclease
MGTANGASYTAHVGRLWLANIGKTESGVVSVTSLWADERVYWPIAFEPYTPAHHFEGGKADPKFRTKLKIAYQLVERALADEVKFAAVVADSFYGEDDGFKRKLEELDVGYVLALKPSHAWWHKEGEIGSPWEAAVEASEAWEDAQKPGEWVKVVRGFRDGHEEAWWALEVDVGPYAVPKESGGRSLPPPIPTSCPTKRRGMWLLTCLHLAPNGLKKKADSKRLVSPRSWVCMA